MLLSINSQVGLKLTPKGIKILEEDWREYKKVIPNLSQYERHIPDEDGCVVMPLWEVMSIFGNEMYMGNIEEPFDFMIKIRDKDLLREE